MICYIFIFSNGGVVVTTHYREYLGAEYLLAYGRASEMEAAVKLISAEHWDGEYYYVPGVQEAGTREGALKLMDMCRRELRASGMKVNFPVDPFRLPADLDEFLEEEAANGQ